MREGWEAKKLVEIATFSQRVQVVFEKHDFTTIGKLYQ